MIKRVFLSVFLVTLAALAIYTTASMMITYQDNHMMQEQQLKDELTFAARGTEEDGLRYLEGLPETSGEDWRLTWVAENGTVLFDSTEDPLRMPNHLERAEITDALATGSSTIVRYSDTLTEQTLYCAKRLEDGSVLRISKSERTIAAQGLTLLGPLAAAAAVAAFAGLFAARRLAKKIAEPLNSLDLDRPLENNTYDELAPLLRRLHQQQQEIREQIALQRKKTDEFEQVTSNMNEGLILLGNSGDVLSINPAACRIFGAEGTCVGRPLLVTDRNPAMIQAIESASETGSARMREVLGGREYQIDLSRIESDGKQIGTALLAFDITEQAEAEKSRREFTANVSHELKTPLQSILGSAELLESGLVPPEDLPAFAAVIRDEASRLVSLVNDIIHLSRLDENVAFPKEDVDLLEIVTSAADLLRPQAVQSGIDVTVEGSPALLTGAPDLLYELTYNLLDNAIKYNRESGTVTVSVLTNDGLTVLTVKDTGIGIAQSEQNRVFERFYRVDKSRSKISGGTGLGLSIVKHAAAYHGAQVHLTSEPGHGTEVEVIFPARTDGQQPTKTVQGNHYDTAD